MAKKRKELKKDSFGFRNRKMDEATWWMQYVGGALVMISCAMRMYSAKWFNATGKEGKDAINEVYNDTDELVRKKLNEE